MTSRSRHLAQYHDFKKGAELDANPPQVHVEAIFLAVFHLIDAFAVSHNIHINKHQLVRYELERNPVIFGDRTDEIWIVFQDIESRLRPKFVYGKNWTKKDFDSVFEKASRIKRICQEVLG